jgi:hypothetical protein
VIETKKAKEKGILKAVVKDFQILKGTQPQFDEKNGHDFARETELL